MGSYKTVYIKVSSQPPMQWEMFQSCLLSEKMISYHLTLAGFVELLMPTEYAPAASKSG